jgi:imidazolonepropionase-like amidohydrolase
MRGLLRDVLPSTDRILGHMHLDPVLDSFYVLGSLWGVLPGPQVCTSSPPAVPSAAREITWSGWLGAPAGVTAFVDVNVVPMDTERVLADQTVLVEGGRIAVLGPSTQVKVPAGAVRIDGRGQYLMPGLGDMHVHFIASDSATIERQLWSWWLANGVTTIRNMDCGARGVWGIHFRDRAAAGELWSPRIYTSGPFWTMKKADIKLDSVATYVARYKAAGYDFIKPYEESPEVLDSVLAAAHRLGIPVAGHVPPTVPIERALAAGLKSIEHLTGAYSGRHDGGALNRDTSLAAFQALVEATQRAGVWHTPTQGLYYAKGDTRVTRWGTFIKALQDAGAGLLLGTDSPIVGPITPTDELQAFVRAGLTPYQALLTGTRNVAEYFGTLDSSGTVAVGKRADVVLVNGNPLEDVTHTRQPAGVMIGGRWLSRAEINRRLIKVLEDLTPAQRLTGVKLGGRRLAGEEIDRQLAELKATPVKASATP